MRIIRKNTFETNSSSTHSITLCDKDCGYNTYIDNGQDYEGTLHVDLAKYGWEWKWISTPYEKLQYVLTQIAQTLCCITDYMDTNEDDEDEAREEIYQSDDFQTILYYVKKNTDFDTIEIGDLDGHIDHGSYVNTLYELCDETGCDSIEDFLFNSSIKIRQGNDNDPDPEEL